MSKTEELFEGGLHVFDDFLGKNIGIREVVGFFEALGCELEDVEAGLVAVDEFSSRRCEAGYEKTTILLPPDISDLSSAVLSLMS